MHRHAMTNSTPSGGQRQQLMPACEPCFACTTGDAFAKAVAKAGYATDPDYAAKLTSIIDQHQLADLDGGS